jgi:SsrA-binding protein
MAEHQTEKALSVNRQAGHNYHLQERFEAGIVLTGTEVKSAREGRVNLRDGYATLKDGEVWLVNSHISPYTHGNIYNHDPLRSRKLLLHKEEIRRLLGKVRERGFTLVPTRMYLKKGRIKVEVALAKGKRQYDKRETERRREADKEARAAIRFRKQT